ncbi:MAG: group I intron-associated PD-(D/E)XK endonuclease [Blastocatellia bacterium]
MRETTYDKGNISESILLHAYLKTGFIVSIPFGSGAPYDLMVDTGQRALKIQVKTGWYQRGCILFRCMRRVRESSPYKARVYSEDEVDYFAVYYPPNDSIYVVPRAACGKGTGYLRIEPVLNGQQKFIRWARDYTWEKHISELQSESSSANRR